MCNTDVGVGVPNKRLRVLRRSTASLELARLTPSLKSLAFPQVLQRIFPFHIEMPNSMCLKDCHGKKEQIIHFGSSLHRRRGGVCSFCGKNVLSFAIKWTPDMLHRGVANTILFTHAN